MNHSHRPRLVPVGWSAFGFLPFLSQPCSPEGERPQWEEVPCGLHKAQVWTALALPRAISKSFKPEDSLTSCPFSLYFFFLGEKSSMQLYTLVAVYEEGVWVCFRVQSVDWLFCALISLLRYVIAHIWWNVIPTLDLRHKWLCVCVCMCVFGGTPVYMFLLPSQDNDHTPPLGNKASQQFLIEII